MDINDAFRNRLEHSSVPPPPLVWEKVEAELRIRRRRRGLIWLWLGLLLTAGAGGGWTWYRQMIAGRNPAKATPVAAATDRNFTESAAIAENASVEKSISKNLLPARPVAPKVVSVRPKDRTTTRHSATAAPQKTAAQPLIEAASLPFAHTPQTNLSPAVSPPLPASPVGTNLAVAGGTTATPHAAAIVPFAESDLPAPQSTAPATSVVGAAISADLLPALSFLEKRNYQTFTPALRLLAPPRTVRPKRSPRKRNRCYNFEQNANVWFLDLYSGPSYDAKLLRSLPDNQPYMAQRLKTEERFFAYNAGVRASFVFNRFYLFRTGLHYDQSTEVFRYFDPAYIQITTVQRPGTNILDTVNIQYGRQTTKVYNRQGKLDIPLLLGAELRKGNTGFSFNGGATFNIAFWKRGQMLHTDTRRPDWFTPSRDRMNVYRNRVGVSVFASTQWFCHLQPRTRLYIEPYFREVLRPVTRTDHPVEERHRIFGVQCGVTRILDKKH
jgi:hypothetical protein